MTITEIFLPFVSESVKRGSSTSVTFNDFEYLEVILATGVQEIDKPYKQTEFTSSSILTQTHMYIHCKLELRLFALKLVKLHTGLAIIPSPLFLSQHQHFSLPI